MILAAAAGGVVMVVVLLHVRSIFLTAVGMLQIILSFPAAYAVYTHVLGLKSFPFLNFIGLYVLIGIGVDDIFVFVDAWRQSKVSTLCNHICSSNFEWNRFLSRSIIISYL